MENKTKDYILNREVTEEEAQSVYEQVERQGFHTAYDISVLETYYEQFRKTVKPLSAEQIKNGRGSVLAFIRGASDLNDIK